MSSQTERESREAWVVDGDGHWYTRTTVLFCDNPSDPGREQPYWWVPAIGCSIPEARLFETEDAAKAALLERLRTDHAEIGRKIAELEAR